MNIFPIRAIMPMLCSISILVSPTFAANENSQGGTTTKSDLEEVRVLGHPLSAEGLSQASAVLSGAELDRKLQGSIGATVAYEPGIHSASFGEAVGRPVIHGQSGARVRVMEDRIDTLDVSVTSGDHATSIEPFIADRVEVLKGASTLLYGSGAIGGVVDVHTGRIPHLMPKKSFTGRAEIRYSDNADKRVGALRLDGGVENIAWHVDGFARDADPYDIPGFVESDRLRAMEAQNAIHQEEEEARDVLPGSELHLEGGALGASMIRESGFFGVSVSLLNANYGLPGGHEHEEDGTPGSEPLAGTPSLDMEQIRFDAEAGLDEPLPGFRSANFRLGINDYQHRELEPGGETGTTFDNQAWEARTELVHNSIRGWEGALGLQVSAREFSAIGEEAFIAPVDTRSIGVFWVGERNVDLLSLEIGARAETLEHKPTGANLADKSFATYSLSAGLVIPLFKGSLLRLHSDYSSRAPVAEELYSDGAHLTTQSYERGNAALQEETATNLAATLSYQSDAFSASATLYHIGFSDYIYQIDTGQEEDGLPLRQYAQADAEFTGFEAEAKLHLLEWNTGNLHLSAMFDTLVAELDISGNNNPPRLPPARVGGGIGGSAGVIDFSLDYLRVAAQRDNAAFELPTDAYDDVRAYLGTRLDWQETELCLFLQGRNLFAPAPGRTIEVGMRITF